MLTSLLLFTAVAFCQELPPKVLYHVGQKALLQENAREKNIPLDVWNTFIMGSGTRFGLVPYRRGLYGGANFDNLELYGNQYFGKSKIPWVMKITLKDECRTEKASTEHRDDPRYLTWMLTNFSEVIRTAQECITQGGEESDDCRWALVGYQSVADGKPENRCDRLQEKFLTDIKAKIVKDEVWKESWYIRDRSCIENIEASPLDVLKVLADSNWDQKSRVATYSGTTGAYGGTAFALLLASLGSGEPVNEHLLETLLSKSQQSDISASFMEEIQEGKFWVRESVPTLLRAYRNCVKNGKRAEFQDISRAFELSLQQEGSDRTQKFLELARNVVKDAQIRCGNAP